MSNKNCIVCHPAAKHRERKAIYQRLVEESTDLSENDIGVIMRAICDMRHYCTEEIMNEKNISIYQKIKNKINLVDRLTIIGMIQGAIFGVALSFFCFICFVFLYNKMMYW